MCSSVKERDSMGEEIVLTIAAYRKQAAIPGVARWVVHFFPFGIRWVAECAQLRSPLAPGSDIGVGGSGEGERSGAKSHLKYYRLKSPNFMSTIMTFRIHNQCVTSNVLKIII